jgi:drug/metabolite transporter (DMT)-like permease
MMHLNSIGQHAKDAMAAQIPSSTHHNERLALATGLGAVLLWSTVATGFKLGLAQLRPLELLWLGSSISFAFFTGACIVSGRIAKLLSLDARDWLRLACLGLVNPFLYYVVLFEAYDRLPAQIAQPLNYTWAITFALLAIPVLGQRMTARTFGAILVSYSGVLILLSQGRLDGFGSVDPAGVALALGSTVIWAGYWLATVRASDDPLVLMTVSFGAGAGAVGIACALSLGLPALTPTRMAYGAWVGLIEMGITFLLWQRAIASTAHAARIGQLIFLAPFVSLLLIERVLGETVHASTWLGLVVIVAGLLLAQRRPVS